MAIRGVEVIASRERCSVSVASCDEPVQSNIVRQAQLDCFGDMACESECGGHEKERIL